MTELRRFRNYIGGEWVPARSGRYFQSENPVTRKPWAEVPDCASEDVDDAVASARAAMDGDYRTLLPQERARLMRRLADLCLEHGPDIAILETLDNGKLIGEQRLLWRLIVEALHFFAGLADKINGSVVANPIPIPTRGLPLPQSFAYTLKEPVGVVAAITPWNSPVTQACAKFAPAFAAGCAMVLKPSEFAPVSSLEFARLVDEAGFPKGAFNVVTSADRQVGAYLAGHPGVDKISFTGSTATGKTIVRIAADRMKRVTCELGGKSASIVFADADLQTAVKGVAAGIFAAAGQTCMASSRVYVERPLCRAFIEALSSLADSMIIGDPMDPRTQIGPLANRAHHIKVTNMLARAREQGAVFASGGDAGDPLGGYYVRPTILTEIAEDMEIMREEIFGPVVCVLPFDEEDEAIERVNDTPYGLAGAVFTQNPARAHRVASRIKAGTIWINTYRIVTHLVPFGGYKQSGWGREGGIESIEAYLETKAIWTPLQ